MQKTARLAGRLISQEGLRTFWGGALPQEVPGPSSEGPRPLLGYWNLLIYLPISQFFDCMILKVTATRSAVENANRWTDNIFNLQSWVKRKFPNIGMVS